MDLHGGEIEIDSERGRGTTVRLLIPQATVRSVAAGAEPARRVR